MVDQEVARDQQFITSRKPDDIPAFSCRLIDAVGEGAARQEAT
jgi:protease I